MYKKGDFRMYTRETIGCKQGRILCIQGILLNDHKGDYMIYNYPDQQDLGQSMKHMDWDSKNILK